MPTVIPAPVPSSPLFRSPTASPAPTAHGPSPTAYPWRSDDLLVARPAARPHVPAARAQARGTFALGGSDPYLTSRNVVDTGGLPARGALLARGMRYRHLALDPYVSRGTRHDTEGSAGTMTPGITVDVARADTRNVSRATVLAMLSTRRLMLRQLGVPPMPVHWSRRRTHLPRKPRATARGDARFHAKHGVRSRHVFPGHEAEGSERAGDMVLPPAPPQSQYGRRDGKGTGKIGRGRRFTPCFA